MHLVLSLCLGGSCGVERAVSVLNRRVKPIQKPIHFTIQSIPVQEELYLQVCIPGEGFWSERR
jgi:hypothetical protein